MYLYLNIADGDHYPVGLLKTLTRARAHRVFVRAHSATACEPRPARDPRLNIHPLQAPLTYPSFGRDVKLVLQWSPRRGDRETSRVGRVGYKPFPMARPFNGELQRLAQADGYYLGRLGKGRAPAAPPKDTSKAVTVKCLTETFDWAISVAGQLTIADLTKSFPAVKAEPGTGLD